MSIEQLKEKLPEFAKDIRLNLGSLFGNPGQSGLTEPQFFATALAVAYTLKNQEITDAVLNDAGAHLTPQWIEAAKIAATLMAMNNVYYRAVHMAENKELSAMPAGLRMNGMMNSGVSKVDFELLALAVSALNGCGMCVHAHVKQLLEHDLGKVGVQSALKIAAVLNAALTALSIP